MNTKYIIVQLIKWTNGYNMIIFISLQAITPLYLPHHSTSDMI